MSATSDDPHILLPLVCSVGTQQIRMTEDLYRALRGFVAFHEIVEQC